MAAKRKVSWEPRARKAEKDLHRMERLRAELSTTMELVTRERDALLAANTELQAVAKAAQETAQTYATNYGNLKQEVVELAQEKRTLEIRLKDADASRKESEQMLVAEIKTLREELKEAPYAAWKAGVRAATQSQTPPTCRCSDLEARVAALERTRGIHETALIAVETKVAALKGGA